LEKAGEIRPFFVGNLDITGIISYYVLMVIAPQTTAVRPRNVGQHSYLAFVDFIEQSAARKKFAQNELMDRERTRAAFRLFISKAVCFYAMKKETIRHRIIHRLFHWFPACP
jgi:hypothetical protein